MKVLIEIARVYYDRVLSQLAEQDALASVLKGAGTIRRPSRGSRIENQRHHSAASRIIAASRRNRGP
jgi:hypothetical protein